MWVLIAATVTAAFAVPAHRFVVSKAHYLLALL